MLPEKYTEFLLSDEIGFQSVEEIGTTEHEKEGDINLNFTHTVHNVKLNQN